MTKTLENVPRLHFDPKYGGYPLPTKSDVLKWIIDTINADKSTITELYAFVAEYHISQGSTFEGVDFQSINDDSKERFIEYAINLCREFGFNIIESHLSDHLINMYHMFLYDSASKNMFSEGYKPKGVDLDAVFKETKKKYYDLYESEAVKNLITGMIASQRINMELLENMKNDVSNISKNLIDKTIDLIKKRGCDPV